MKKRGRPSALDDGQAANYREYLNAALELSDLGRKELLLGRIVHDSMLEGRHISRRLVARILEALGEVRPRGAAIDLDDDEACNRIAAVFMKKRALRGATKISTLDLPRARGNR